MVQEPTDSDLLAAYRRGDANAFDALYARHRVSLFNFLLNHSGRRRHEVEDVFQETWIKVIRHADSFDCAKPFAPWLYRIARNCLTDRWRHLAAVESIHVSDDIAMSGASSNGTLRPERAASGEDIRRRWETALAALPALQREVVLLKLETDLDLDTLAEITGAPRETVKSRLRYGMNRLREMLQEVSHESA